MSKAIYTLLWALVVLGMCISACVACPPPSPTALIDDHGTMSIQVWQGASLTLSGGHSIPNSDSIASYLWTCGSATSIMGANEPTATFNFAQAGSYTVYLRVKNNNGIWSAPSDPNTWTPCTVTVCDIVTASQRYVAPAPVGNNNNSGLSPSSPWATVQYALSQTTGNVVINLADGTFTGAGNVNVQLTDKTRLVAIRSVNGNPANCVIDCQSSNRAFRIYECDNNGSNDKAHLIQGITIKNGYGIASSSYPTPLSNDPSGTTLVSGGAIYCGKSHVTISNCIIKDSCCVGVGLLPNGGGLTAFMSNPSLRNCLFKGNTSDYGGALYSDHSNPGIINCTFTQNTANHSDSGGGMCAGPVLGSFVQIANSIFWGNGGGVHELFLSGTNNKVYANYSCIAQDTNDIRGSEYVWLTGNIGTDPQLSGEGYLTANSTNCINHGMPATGGISYAGQKDVHNENRVNGSVVDIGADEYYAYMLSVTSYSGTVTKNPSKSSYDYGDQVTLTVVPDPGYAFLFWMGDLTGSANPATVTMTCNKAITAALSDTIPPDFGGVYWQGGYTPQPLDAHTLTMRAGVATDIHGPMYYKFLIKKGDTIVQESDWQLGDVGRAFIATGLDANTSYTCQVSAKDSIGNIRSWCGDVLVSTSGDNEPQGSAKAVSGEMGSDLALSIDPYTGMANYSIPIVVPPARQGAEPKISLNYNSGGSNGWCGVGWGMTMGSIQRDGQEGVPVDWTGKSTSEQINSYDDAKGFRVSMGASNGRLILVNASVTVEINGSSKNAKEYRTEIEQSFVKFLLVEDNRWLAIDKSGNWYLFGQSDDSRMVHPQFKASHSGSTGVQDTYLWGLDSIEDINGNVTYIDYYPQGEINNEGALYLKQIACNGNVNDNISAKYIVDFILRNDRSDKTFSYATGYRVESDRLLSRIEVKVWVDNPNQPLMVRTYKLSYGNTYDATDVVLSPSTRRALLRHVTVYGNAGGHLPPMSFNYTEKSNSFGEPFLWTNVQNNAGTLGCPPMHTITDEDNRSYGIASLVDVNRDGLPDRLFRVPLVYQNPAHWHVQYNQGLTASGYRFADPVDFGPLAYPAGYSNYALFNGIHGQSTSSNMSSAGISSLLDINGDGFPDRVMLKGYGNGYSYAPPNNYYVVQKGTGNGFEGSLFNWINVDNQNLNQSLFWHSMNSTYSESGAGLAQMLDMNGDGLSDRLMHHSATPYTRLKVQYNLGSGFENSHDWMPLDTQGHGDDAMWGASSAITTDTNPPVGSESHSRIDMMDINGDGLPDRVMIKDSGQYQTYWKVQFNTGYGFDPCTRDWPGIAIQALGEGDYANIKQTAIQRTVGYDCGNGDGGTVITISCQDINGDGLPDRIAKPAEGLNTFYVQLNTGSGFASFSDWTNVHGGINPNSDNDCRNSIMWSKTYSVTNNVTLVMLCDINGDGLLDRVLENKDGQNSFIVQLNEGSKPDLLAKVTGALGGWAEVAYAPSTSATKHQDNQGENQLPMPIWTATTLKINDGMGTESVTRYEYERGRYDYERKEFCGFGKVTVTEGATDIGVKSITCFHQGGGWDDAAKGEFEDDVAGAFTKKGMPYRSESYAWDSAQSKYLLYSVTVNKVMVAQVYTGVGSDTGMPGYMPYVANTITMSYEGLDYAAGGFTASYIATCSENVYNTATAPITGNIKQVRNYGYVRLGDTDAAIAGALANHSYTDSVLYDNTVVYTNYVHEDNSAYTGANILNKVRKSWTEINGTKVKEDCFYYDKESGGDSLPGVSRPTGVPAPDARVPYSGLRGNVTGVYAWFKDENRYIPSWHTYYNNGNRRCAFNCLGIKTETFYDNSFNTHPVKVVTADNSNFTSFSVYTCSGAVIRMADNATKLVTKNVYDEFYRLTGVYSSRNRETVNFETTWPTWADNPAAYPDQCIWHTQIQYNLGGISGGVTSNNYIDQISNRFHARTYCDGLGRVIQSRAEAKDTATSDDYRVTDTYYNHRGKAYKQTLPKWGTGPAFARLTGTQDAITTFDGLGRAVLVTPPAGDTGSPMASSKTEFYLESLAGIKYVDVAGTEYDAGTRYVHRTRSISAWGSDAERKTDSYADHMGQTVRLVEDPGALNVPTQYVCDVQGRLRKIVDSANNAIVYGYDSLGRKNSTIDSDMGTWTYAYDDLGRLETQMDGRNNRIEMYYDVNGVPDIMGRLLKKEIYENQSTLKKTVTLHYDSNFNPVIGANDFGYANMVWPGQLFMVVEKDGSGNVITWTKSGCDAHGRVIKSARYMAVNGYTYTSLATYDAADRQVTATYPNNAATYPNNAATLYYSYDGNGNLKTIQSIAGTGANETFYTSGVGSNNPYNEQGLLTGMTFGNGVTTSYGYYTNSHRRQQIVTNYGATNIQSFTYTYDAASNFTEITDGVNTTGNASNTLTNINTDKLGRLASAYSVATGTTINYGYNALGNMLSNSELGGSGYTYGGGKPHAVTAVGSRTYGYDACGNMITRYRPDQPADKQRQWLDYDAQNRLTKVTIDKNSNNVKESYPTDTVVEFTYADDGSRLWKKVDGNVADIWVGDSYEIRGNGYFAQVICHVSAGGREIATFEPQSYLAGIIGNNVYLAQTTKWVGKGCYALFGGGRTPVTVPALCLVVGLVCGLVALRRRRDHSYGDAGWQSARILTYQPVRRAIAALLMGGICLLGIPNEAFADGPPNPLPWMVYNHGDHLGSSSVITAGRTDAGFTEGQVVQQYGYKPFGNERYKQTSNLENVQRRYTGQILDEETGLYYYNARYYDAEMGRFVQADTEFATGSPDSQALNRYSYCVNNPLVFTDPTGNFLGLDDIFVAIISSAVISGLQAEAAGGNFLEGAWKGAVNGLCTSYLGPIAGGALGAALTGGNPAMAALSGCISQGLASVTGSLGNGILDRLGGAHPSLLVADQWARYGAELAMSTGTAALVGGIMAEIQGGDFWKGASDAAKWGAAGYVLASVLNQDAPPPDAVEQDLCGICIPVKDNIGYLTDEIIQGEMQRAFDEQLRDKSQFRLAWAPIQVMGDVMGFDSWFRGLGAFKLCYKGVIYDGYSVNYVAVGMAHKHYNVSLAGSFSVRRWNEKGIPGLKGPSSGAYGNPGSDGKYFFCNYGMSNYNKMDGHALDISLRLPEGPPTPHVKGGRFPGDDPERNSTLCVN